MRDGYDVIFLLGWFLVNCLAGLALILVTGLVGHWLLEL